MPALQTARSDEFRALLRDRLPEKTYRHSVSVSEFMMTFAGELKLGAEEVAAAGLLHDLCKPLQGDALLERAKDMGIEPTELQRMHPTLLHGAVAAEEVRGVLGVDDEDVYSAIYWHTTGRPEWCALGLALYVADFAEPLRPRPEAEKARSTLASEGFDAALRYVAAMKLSYVRTLPHLDPMTEAFTTWMLDRAT